MQLTVHLVPQRTLPPGEDGIYTEDEATEDYEVLCAEDNPSRDAVLSRMLTDIVRRVRARGTAPAAS